MALHYDAEVERFRDDGGHFVSYERGIRSSVAREEYYAAHEAELEEEAAPEDEDEGESRFTREQLKAFEFFDRAPEVFDWDSDAWDIYDDYFDLDYADDDIDT